MTAVAIDHRDRFRWMKHVWATPKEKLSGTVKVVLCIIGEAVDAKTGRAVRTQEWIAAAAGGITDRTVRNAIADGERLGLITVEQRGGGIIYDGNGIGHGRPAHFRMALEPGTALPGMVTDTRKESATYPERKCDLPGKEMSDTRNVDSDNPLSYPPSFPMESPDSVVEAPEVQTADPVSNELREEEEKNFRIGTLWKGRLPDESEVLPAWSNILDCRRQVSVHAATLIGAPERHVELLEKIPAGTMGRLAPRLHHGRLKAIELVRVLQSLGYAPAGSTASADEEKVK